MASLPAFRIAELLVAGNRDLNAASVHIEDPYCSALILEIEQIRRSPDEFTKALRYGNR